MKDSPQAPTACNSIIKPESQVVGEAIPIVGAPFQLTYFTSRIQGRTAEYKTQFFPNGNTSSFTVNAVSPPFTLTYAGTDVSVKELDGTVLFSRHYLPTDPIAAFPFQWTSPTGLGAKKLRVDISTVYDRSDMTVPNSYDYSWDFNIGSFRAESLGLGGWYPSHWFYYDIATNELFSPDGNRRSVTATVLANGELRVAAEDGSEVYEFDAAGRHLRTRTFLLGSVLRTFAYTPSGKLDRVTERNQAATVFHRNANEKWISVTSPSGKTSKVVLTPAGYLARITDPVGQSYTMTYQGTQGLLKTFQKPTLETSTFTYDGDGNLTKDEHSSGVWFTLEDLTQPPDVLSKSITSREGTQTVYDASFLNGDPANSGMSTTQTGLGYSNSYQRNDASSETWIDRGIRFDKYAAFDTARFPQQWRPAYATSDDSSGNLRSYDYADIITPSPTTDPWTFTSWLHQANLRKDAVYLQTSSLFTTNNRTWLTTTPLGNTYTTVLDTAERPVSFKKGTLTPVKLTYENDQIKTIQQTPARTTTFNYDPTTRLLTSVVNALNQTTRFGYDASERLTSLTLPDLSVASFTYDASGRIVGITPPTRPVHELSIHPVERLGAYTAPNDTTSTTFDYNLDRHLSTITRPSGRTIAFDYDPIAMDLVSIATDAGTTAITRTAPYRRIASLTTAAGIETQFTYSGDYVSREELIQGPVSASSEKAFLAEGKVSSIDVQVGAGPVDRIAYAYNNDEQVTQAGNLVVSYSGAPNGLLRGTHLGVLDETFTINTLGEITARTVKHGAAVLYREALTRDSLGRIATRKLTVRGWPVKSYKYLYDDRGRLTEVQDGLSAWMRRYDYDANGNRTGWSVASPAQTTSSSYDDQDRLLSSGSRTYAYNPDGELQRRSDAALGQTASYVYDALGNLTEVRLEDGTLVRYEVDALNRRVSRKVNSTVTRRYVWEQNRLIAELNADGSLKRRYVYATRSHVPDYYVEAGVNYKIVTDVLGSPIMVIKADDGKIVQRIEYDEFGNVLRDNRSGELAIGFAGGLSDWRTKLVRFGARDYDPMTGRWTSKDPILFAGGDLNLYGYVLNDPINWVDPLGLSSVLFDAINNALMFYDKDGYLVGTFEAGNNTTSTSGGPWPSGQFPYSHYVPHPESSSTGPYGLYGNHVFHVPGRPGMGIHAGRTGPQSKTLGCVRTTETATMFLMDLNRIDPLRTITVIRGGGGGGGRHLLAW